MRFLIQQLGFTRHYVSAVAESYEHEFEADRHSIRKAARALRSVFSSDDMPEVFTDEMQEVLARFHPASFKVMLQPKTLSNLLHTCLQIALGLIVKTRPYSGGLFSII